VARVENTRAIEGRYWGTTSGTSGKHSRYWGDYKWHEWKTLALLRGNIIDYKWHEWKTLALLRDYKWHEWKTLALLRRLQVARVENTRAIEGARVENTRASVWGYDAINDITKCSKKNRPKVGNWN